MEYNKKLEKRKGQSRKRKNLDETEVFKLNMYLIPYLVLTNFISTKNFF